MTNREFTKLVKCFELLALTRVISDKRTLLKNELFNCYSKEELNSIIDLAIVQKDLTKNFIKADFNLGYGLALTYAKQNEEAYKRLFNLVYCSYHNFLLLSIRDKYDEYKEDCERYYKPEAKMLKEELVTE